MPLCIHRMGVIVVVLARRFVQTRPMRFTLRPGSVPGNERRVGVLAGGGTRGSAVGRCRWYSRRFQAVHVPSGRRLIRMCEPDGRYRGSASEQGWELMARGMCRTVVGRLVLAGFVTTVAWAAYGGSSPSGATAESVSTVSMPIAVDPVLVAPSAGVARSPIAPDAPVAQLVAGFNDAGFDLWRTQPTDANLVFSPASVAHALLMARAAADDATGAAIDAAFALPAGESAHAAWNSVDHQLAAAQSDQVIVRFADRIWPRADVAPDQRWVDLLASEHGADVETLDLAGDPDGSREVINQWVSDQTEALIPELLPDGFIDPLTVLVLTDAVYFAADWATPFGKYGTQPGTFTTLDGQPLDVEFMRELELADRRGLGDGFAAAEVPYAGNQFSMLVIVPDIGRFDEVRDHLDTQLLADLDATLTTGPYELLLPKWDVHTQLDLTGRLTEIGAAPGSYPAISADAFLAAGVHAADITVDEFGTVAAASTGLAFAVSGPPEPELTIAADKPFLYLIRHRSSGLVLFAGQLTNPA
jgi:serine protease inhibitor